MKKFRSRVTLAASVSCLVVVAACSSSGSNNAASQPKGTLDVAIMLPFTGSSSVNGQSSATICSAAVLAVNGAGGVLGHQLKCLPVDTKGDPADALPAAEQALAVNGNKIVVVIGPATNDSPPVIPILEKAHITNFSNSGSSVYDNNHFTYFWRDEASDDAAGVALGLAAYKAGYRRVAMVFSSDVAGQGIPTAASAVFRHLGGTVVNNTTILLDRPSYQSEVAKVLASHPQAIFTETDPQTAATFYSELQTANGGHLLPIIGDNSTFLTPWLTAISQAVGLTQFMKSYSVIEQATNGPATAIQAWDKYLMSVPKGQAPFPAKILAQVPQAAGPYEGVTIAALAMLEAHSVLPSVYNKFIPGVVSAKPGATLVYDFQQGKTALAAGKKIQFIGPNGVLAFNAYHNTFAPFELAHLAGSLAHISVSFQIPESAIVSAELAAHVAH